MATKTGNDDDKNKKKPAPGEQPIQTQMVGEHGDDDLGYDPSIIPTEKIPDDD
ncbi:MAG TPA: hypothetical protein VGF99_15195 [Myxococcota bacterium]